MTEADHRELLELLHQCEGKVMLSGYPSELYDRKLADWDRHTFDLPNNAANFADLADKVADRVIIDTYFDGDGSGGRRSRWLGMAELYERIGYREWFRPGAEQELLQVMRARLGDNRVLFSRDGFNAV